MVIVIVGVLSLAVAPRMFNAEDFRRSGFEREFVAALRYSQKSAIAANCPVSFTVTAGAYSATFTAACPGGAAVALPSLTGSGVLSGNVPDETAFSITAPATGTVTFDGAGRATGDGTFTLNATDSSGYSRVFAISATGYVQ